jgi:hypothetical protein
VVDDFGGGLFAIETSSVAQVCECPRNPFRHEHILVCSELKLALLSFRFYSTGSQLSSSRVSFVGSGLA